MLCFEIVQSCNRDSLCFQFNVDNMISNTVRVYTKLVLRLEVYI
jgi:hypothetical protein